MKFMNEIDKEAMSIFFRDELISEKCFFSLYRESEFLRKTRFYLNTLENFIEKEKTAELESLNKHARRIPESKRGDFWACNYPILWEEIFEEQLRRSFLVSLTSFLENHLKTICWEVAIIKKLNEDPRSWNERVYNKSQKLLQKICCKIKDREWNFVCNLYELRNVFVHFDGGIELPKNKGRKVNIYNFIKS